MIDISNKYQTLRIAVAEARLKLHPKTLQMVSEGRIPKGDPIQTARIAAIASAKRTSELIPFCHPLSITYTGVEFILGDDSITVQVTVKAIAATGVEMEALTAASIAALTLYDMLKPVDKELSIEGSQLLEKRGGKSEFHESVGSQLRTAVVVMSDSVDSGKKSDTSGRLIEQRVRQEGLELIDYKVLPDEANQIVDWLIHLADDLKADLILTTGGTGFSPRDTTPEAMQQVIDREIPGIPEAIRSYGQQRTPYSMLSRAKAGLRGRTLIVNLPGSRKGVAESLDMLFPAILHAFPMIWGESGWNKSSHQEPA